jgi:hypothetical protein
MKHVQQFENYIYESEVNETLHEASTAGRAWSGQIANIDKLLSWMYDKGILNKGEKAEKDTRFRQYYRYYNDGDFPAGLKSKGISKWSEPAKITSALEQYIEEFIKKVLAKYTGKYDRKDFRIDTLLGDLNTLQFITGGREGNEPDPHSLLNYWGAKINTSNSEFEKMLGELRPLYDDAKKAANEIVDKERTDGVYKDTASFNIPGNSNTLAYQRLQLQTANVWSPAAEKKYMKMKDHMMKMSAILSNVITATQELKKETGV